MSADVVLAAVHVLEQHGRVTLRQMAGIIGQPCAEVRRALEAFNDVEVGDRVLEPLFLIEPAVDILRTTLLVNVSGRAAYRTRVAAILQHAADRRRELRITYANTWAAAVSTRTIPPYRVLSTRRGYEVDAGPLDDQGRPRNFLLTGIHQLQVLESTFEVPAEAPAAVEYGTRADAGPRRRPAPAHVGRPALVRAGGAGP